MLRHFLNELDYMFFHRMYYQFELIKLYIYLKRLFLLINFRFIPFNEKRTMR